MSGPLARAALNLALITGAVSGREGRGAGAGTGERERAGTRAREGEGAGTRARARDVTSPDVVFIIADVLADALADTVPMH